MTSFFCPKCWASIAESVRICPTCGTDIAQWKSEHDYGDQLIAALHHPIPTTAVIAAQVLGQRRELKAVPELIKMLNETADFYLAEAVVEALGKVGDTQARNAVHAALRHRFARVRARAGEVLESSSFTLAKNSTNS